MVSHERMALRLLNRLLSSGLALVVVGSAAHGQASRFVAPAARVYRDIERLADAGLIGTILVGVRPYSAREIVRLLSEARRNLERNDHARAWAEAVIADNLDRHEPRANRAVDLARVELADLDSPYRGIPADSNGSISAVINPLAAYRGGRPIADGTTATLETEHSATGGRHLALFANPRVSTRRVKGEGGSNINTARLQTGGANILLGNFSIEVARDYVLFGQSPTGGLLLSENAPPLDMVRLSNDRPAPLPWLFRYLGPLRGTLFVADLGTESQRHAHPKLIGYHLAAHPHPRLEMGVEVLDETGGRGAPPASFGDRVIDAIPLIDVAFQPNRDFQFSNKFAGLDIRWSVPRLAGMALYAEGAVDDFDARRLRSSLLEDAGYIAGMSLACITECGRLGLRAEYRQTGIRYYTHTDFPSGIQQNGVLIGDPLGPRGLGGYLSLDAELSALWALAVIGAYEVRSGNRYASTASGPQDSGFRFVQVEHHPGEHRSSALITWTSPSRRSRSAVSATVGIERISNFAFVDGRDRTNGLAQLHYEWRP
jgi:hypothetical protein